MKRPWILMLLAMLLAAGAGLGHVASRGNWHFLIPDTTLVTTLKHPSSVKDVVVELDSAGVYHIYIKDAIDAESHDQRPLDWPLVVGKKDLSVQLGEAGAVFRFWFGSLSRLSADGSRSLLWFTGDGKALERSALDRLASQHEVELDRWSFREQPGALHLRLVGNFESVRGGFVHGSNVYHPGTSEPIAKGSGMHPSSDSPPQFITLDLPRESSGDLVMAVDLAWGDEVVSLAPKVGATDSFEDFAAHLVLLEPVREAYAATKGHFAAAFKPSLLGVECTTAAFYFSKPEMAHFVYPEMISRSGQKEIRYFSGADIRLVCMPMRMPNLDRIRLHHRNHRIRALFPIGHLKLPGNGVSAQNSKKTG